MMKNRIINTIKMVNETVLHDSVLHDSVLHDSVLLTLGTLDFLPGPQLIP